MDLVRFSAPARIEDVGAGSDFSDRWHDLVSGLIAILMRLPALRTVPQIT